MPFPPIEPYQSGLLQTGDGNQVYWEACGNPDGLAVLVEPHACDPAADMSLNTTTHLVSDMEQLREHVDVQRWLLYGGSWAVP